MSAKEMFEELGYEKIEDALTIQYIDKFNNQTRFWKNTQMIEMFGQKITDFDTENNEYYCASFELFQAINKQIEELGWK